MGLESSVNFIADLNPLWPLGSDQKRYGDNHVQNLKKALLQCFAGFAGSVIVTGTDGGVVNAYTVVPSTLPPSLSAKTIVVFAPTITNTGASTLAFAGLGVKNLKSVSGDALAAGDLVAGSVYAAFYNGTEFRLLSITKNYVDQLAFNSALPAQPGTAVRYRLQTLSGAASWTLPTWDYEARTANTILAASDSGKFIDITANTFTQTFTAAATLGDEWFVMLRNSGTGDITLDANGSETIDGLTTYVMYPGECRFISCNGTAFTSQVLAPFHKTFTATGTFTKPPGYRAFGSKMWSGGASGQRTNNTVAISVGGAGGGCFEVVMLDSEIGTTETVTIGAGGAAVTTVANGNPGGDTSFGSLVTVTGATFTTGGAVAGWVATSSDVRPDGYASSASTSNSKGGAWGGASPSSDATQAGVGTIHGGGSGGSLDATATLRAASTSLFGGDGGAASSVSSATAGTAPGGGGGATQTGVSSGAGARGELRIWGVA